MAVAKASSRTTKEVRLVTAVPGGKRAGVGSRPSAKRNALEETIELYGVRNWGSEYFDVNPDGELVLIFEGTRGTPIALKDVVTEVQKRGLSTPIVLRFPQILDHQIKKLATAFKSAIEEFEYKREYFPIFPIKVNQLKEVVQEVLDFGDRYNLGLEVGSKAELTVALALTKREEAPIICNGVKDEGYLRLALMGKQIGKKVFVVLESLFELRLVDGAEQEDEGAPLYWSSSETFFSWQWEVGEIEWRSLQVWVHYNRPAQMPSGAVRRAHGGLSPHPPFPYWFPSNRYQTDS